MEHLEYKTKSQNEKHRRNQIKSYLTLYNTIKGYNGALKGLSRSYCTYEWWQLCQKDNKLEGPLIGKRTRSRPTERWLGDIIKTVGKNWTDKASDRSRWRWLEETPLHKKVLYKWHKMFIKSIYHCTFHLGKKGWIIIIMILGYS